MIPDPELHSSSCILEAYLHFHHGYSDEALNTLDSCMNFSSHELYKRSLRALIKTEKGDFSAAIGDLSSDIEVPDDTSLLVQKAALYALSVCTFLLKLTQKGK